MARKANFVRRIVPADARHGSDLVARFINKLMSRGKKTVAENSMYEAMDVLADKTKQEPLRVLTRAVENVKPLVEVKSRRVGGANYQVPVEIRPERREALALRWIMGFARDRKGGTMGRRLGSELLDAFNNTGSSVKKKEDTHRNAEANKAFAHYRW